MPNLKTAATGQESSRLAELQRYQLLDSEPDQLIQAIVEMAAELLDAPISLVSLVDESRQWFYAKQGIRTTETPRRDAICAYTIQSNEPLVIPDASKDPVFKHNALVNGEPNIRFYAGIPLITPTGHRLGSLCVIDTRPREISEAQLRQLSILAQSTMSFFNHRTQLQESNLLLAERNATLEKLRDSEQLNSLVIEATQTGVWDWNLLTKNTEFSKQWLDILGIPEDQAKKTDAEWEARIHPEDLAAVQQWVAISCNNPDVLHAMDYRLQHQQGHYVWVNVQAIYLQDENGVVTRGVGSMMDITEQRTAEQKIKTNHQQLQKIMDQVSALVGVMNTDGVLLEANQTALVMADTAIDRVIGRPFWDSYWFSHSLAVQRQVKDAVESARQGRKVRFDCEIRVRRDERRTIDLSIQPVFNEEGELELLVPSAVDVTERRGAEKELFAAKESAEIILESIFDAVIATDNAGMVTGFNHAATELLNLNAADAIGRHVSNITCFLDEKTMKPIPHPVLSVLESPTKIALGAETLLGREGTKTCPVTGGVSPIIDQAGKITGTVTVLRDVSEERAKSLELSYEASHDLLTNLPNRREFERRLKSMLGDGDTTSMQHALCFLDLDNFKFVNDEYGHDAGDALLTQVSKLMREKVRDRDTLARVGGDEFALILGDCPPDRAVDIATNLCSAVRDYRFKWQDSITTIGVSIGVAFVSESNNHYRSIIKLADRACYEAKRSGRNQVHVHAGELSAA